MGKVEDENKYKYIKPTTIWNNKLDKTIKIINKSNLSKEEKEFLLEDIIKESRMLMNVQEKNTWFMLFMRQDIEMILTFSPLRWNEKAQDIYKKSKEKYGSDYDPDLTDKLIKVIDMKQMWNWFVMQKEILNRLLMKLSVDVEYDLFGEKVEVKKDEEGKDGKN